MLDVLRLAENWKSLQIGKIRRAIKSKCQIHSLGIFTSCVASYQDLHNFYL